MEKFYTTTAIDYVNGAPHIGHAYEKILTDVIYRHFAQRTKDAYMLTGTDEHGIKIQKTKEFLTVEVTGNGFLYNMVRILVGTLLDVGLEKKSENDLKEMLLTGKREKGGKTLPAKGLCLVGVEY